MDFIRFSQRTPDVFSRTSAETPNLLQLMQLGFKEIHARGDIAITGA